MNNSYLFTRLLLWSTMLLLLHACHKPDTTDTNEYVVETVTSNIRMDIDNYEYNDKWQLVKYKDGFQYNSRHAGLTVTNYFYTSDGRVEGTETQYMYIAGERTEFTYNSQGRPILTKTYNKTTGMLKYTDEYTYNGQTIARTHSADTGKVYVSTYTIDDRGNIVKAITDYTNPLEWDITEQWLDYDDNKNLTGPAVADVASKNNYRKYTKQSIIAYQELLFKHTYNNAGYVTESTFIDPKVGFIRSLKYVLIPKR